jgi:hypothetical protein
MIEYDVFLGGSCNPTTWRTDVAVPMLDAAGLRYFNPQTDDWSPAQVDIENQAKIHSQMALFVIDNQTRAIASILEATELICDGFPDVDDILLVIDDIKDGTVIDGQTVTGRELKDLNRARQYLRDLATRHSVEISGTIPEAINLATRRAANVS